MNIMLINMHDTIKVGFYEATEMIQFCSSRFRLLLLHFHPPVNFLGFRIGVDSRFSLTSSTSRLTLEACFLTPNIHPISISHTLCPLFMYPDVDIHVKCVLMLSVLESGHVYLIVMTGDG